MTAEIEHAEPNADYSFAFSEEKKVWVCSVHGEVATEDTAWVNCWVGYATGKCSALSGELNQAQKLNADLAETNRLLIQAASLWRSK